MRCKSHAGFIINFPYYTRIENQQNAMQRLKKEPHGVFVTIRLFPAHPDEKAGAPSERLLTYLAQA